MSRRLLAVLVLTLTVLLAGAGSLYAFDRNVQKRIADGVTVNGVDVGGLTPERARAKLSAALLEPLDRPVIDGILDATATENYRFRDLLEQVVLSPAFRSK